MILVSIRVSIPLRQGMGDAALLELLFQGLGVAEVAGSVAAFADDEAADAVDAGFVVLVSDAVVADERIGHHDDLLGIRRVGDDLLVAYYGGVEDDFAYPAAVGADPGAVEFLPVFKYEFFLGVDHYVSCYIPLSRP